MKPIDSLMIVAGIVGVILIAVDQESESKPAQEPVPQVAPQAPIPAQPTLPEGSIMIRTEDYRRLLESQLKPVQVAPSAPQAPAPQPAPEAPAPTPVSEPAPQTPEETPPSNVRISNQHYYTADDAFMERLGFRSETPGGRFQRIKEKPGIRRIKGKLVDCENKPHLCADKEG